MNWTQAFINSMSAAMTLQMAAFQQLAAFQRLTVPRNNLITKTGGELLPITSNIIQLHEKYGEKK